MRYALLSVLLFLIACAMTQAPTAPTTAAQALSPPGQVFWREVNFYGKQPGEQPDRSHFYLGFDEKTVISCPIDRACYSKLPGTKHELEDEEECVDYQRCQPLAADSYFFAVYHPVRCMAEVERRTARTRDFPPVARARAKSWRARARAECGDKRRYSDPGDTLEHGASCKERARQQAVQTRLDDNNRAVDTSYLLCVFSY